MPVNSTGRWRRLFSDSVFLFLLPLLISALPWRVGFALLRWLAKLGVGFGDVVQAAWVEASRTLPALDRNHFCSRFRLLLLVDRCDSLLCLLRSRRWWHKQVDVHGDELTRVPSGLLLNSHWGSGNWIWQLLKANGTPAWFVARRAGVGDVGRGVLSRAYLAWRVWALHLSDCLGIIYTGGSSANILGTLRRGHSVLGMLDLPARPDQSHASVQLCGRNVRFPVGLATLANRAGVGCSIVSCGLDMESGRRSLHVEVLPAELGVDEIMRRYAAHLERRIETNPAQWQAWPQAVHLFDRANRA